MISINLWHFYNELLMKRIRHKTLKTKARKLDKELSKINTSRFPRKKVQELAKKIFPDCEFEGGGWHKDVFYITSRNKKRDLVIKIAQKRKIKGEVKIYKMVGKDFAKIYWNTKYVALQEFGDHKSEVPKEEIKRLKGIGLKFRLNDVRKGNIAKFGNRFKIIDADTEKMLEEDVEYFKKTNDNHKREVIKRGLTKLREKIGK